MAGSIYLDPASYFWFDLNMIYIQIALVALSGGILWFYASLQSLGLRYNTR